MKYPMYCVKDKKVGFMPPFCDSGDQTAIRRFTYDINQGNDYMRQFPDDYEMYKVGEFDTDNGKMKVETPCFIVSGSDVFGVNAK